jgi:hypothetical protein
VRTWFVVLELDAGSTASVLDFDAIERLLKAAAQDGAVVRYSSALRSLQFEIEADTPHDGLVGALSVWRVAARKSGTRRWPLASVVITPSGPAAHHRSRGLGSASDG